MDKIKLGDIALALRQIRSGNVSSLSVGEQTIECIDKLLPHGSGIDDKHFIDVAKSNEYKIVIYVEFHHLHDNGHYTGWSRHTVQIIPSFIHGFELKIGGRDVNGIKEYLADMYGELFGD